MKTKALLDSGANTIYIDKAYAQKMKLPLTPLSNPVPVYNVDGTWNTTRSITHCAEIIIQFQEHHEKVTAEVTNLGKNQMILSYTWLSRHILRLIGPQEWSKWLGVPGHATSWKRNPLSLDKSNPKNEIL